MKQAYETPKIKRGDFSYIKGEESHLARRRMILKDHPEIAKLLDDKRPNTIIVASVVICISMANCYMMKVLIY